jgi:enoyl-CoA hydratase/carnithine racemase
MVLGERHTARDLEALGLVGWVVPREAMLPKALEIAGQVATKSRFSVGQLKRLLVEGLDDHLERALRMEARITEAAFERGEAAERVRKFTERKRPPERQ